MMSAASRAGCRVRQERLSRDRQDPLRAVRDLPIALPPRLFAVLMAQLNDSKAVGRRRFGKKFGGTCRGPVPAIRHTDEAALPTTRSIDEVRDADRRRRPRMDRIVPGRRTRRDEAGLRVVRPVAADRQGRRRRRRATAPGHGKDSARRREWPDADHRPAVPGTQRGHRRDCHAGVQRH